MVSEVVRPVAGCRPQVIVGAVLASGVWLRSALHEGAKVSHVPPRLRVEHLPARLYGDTLPTQGGVEVAAEVRGLEDVAASLARIAQEPLHDDDLVGFVCHPCGQLPRDVLSSLPQGVLVRLHRALVVHGLGADDSALVHVDDAGVGCPWVNCHDVHALTPY